MTQNQLTQYAPCPNCGSTDATKVKYTWWGGALGPSMFTHVKCNSCNTQYNGKTGKSNSTNIILYFVISMAIVFCLCLGLGILRALLNS
jgi:transposase-like protein